VTWPSSPAGGVDLEYMESMARAMAQARTALNWALVAIEEAQWTKRQAEKGAK
jgi:hypothetical protein